MSILAAVQGSHLGAGLLAKGWNSADNSLWPSKSLGMWGRDPSNQLPLATITALPAPKLTELQMGVVVWRAGVAPAPGQDASCSTGRLWAAF